MHCQGLSEDAHSQQQQHHRQEDHNEPVWQQGVDEHSCMPTDNAKWSVSGLAVCISKSQVCDKAWCGLLVMNSLMVRLHWHLPNSAERPAEYDQGVSHALEFQAWYWIILQRTDLKRFQALGVVPAPRRDGSSQLAGLVWLGLTARDCTALLLWLRLPWMAVKGLLTFSGLQHPTQESKTLRLAKDTTVASTNLFCWMGLTKANHQVEERNKECATTDSCTVCQS